jgi:hypothetical protein
MPISEYLKTCPECQEEFEARRLNQKFCTLECKTRFNNRGLRKNYLVRKASDNICGEINAILFKNRQLLKQFEGKSVKVEELKQLGFKLKYITSFEQKKDVMAFYCYDYGYEQKDELTINIYKRIN